MGRVEVPGEGREVRATKIISLPWKCRLILLADKVSCVQEQDSQQPHRVCAHCTSLQLPWVEITEGCFRVGGTVVASDIAHASTQSWQHGMVLSVFPGEPRCMVRARRSMLDTHQSIRITVCSYLLPRLSTAA